MILAHRWIARVIDRDTARERFLHLDTGYVSKARVSRFVSRWAPCLSKSTDVSSEKSATRLEPVYLPHALVAVSMILPRDRRKRVEVLVDGYTDAAVMLRGGHNAIPGLADSSESESESAQTQIGVGLAEAFPYPKTEADTMNQARSVLTKVRLSRWLPAGTRMGEDMAVIAIVHKPYWVRYRRGGNGRIGFKMLCGVTGDWAGLQAERGFLAAITSDSSNSSIP